ncbi:unnamed protein product [Rotaria sp. Silwood1]|nr:unnamed protein product [Rotaria sp. Silwood1]
MISHRKSILMTKRVDVIVVCSSSEVLIEYVLQTAGFEFRKEYEKKKSSAGQFQSFLLECPKLLCQQVLFLTWIRDQNPILVEQTLRGFIAEAIEHVRSRGYTSVAFPAIGCGRADSCITFIAQTMIDHVKIEKYPLNITFVIHSESQEIYNAFKSAYGKKKTVKYIL